ncbi:hypothetical protein BUALT_Bualt19G0007900 [Buddleja alternifolia]|uniref:Uncharacterized protein n=1 Tax=Buddleja alternifolia TaxID=168488 RepID=A0AAV6W8G6_9LAMI|nr:hypothetical protein BUALT_Bualt19G0007900 [Buddleja alternifolia]
MVSVYPNPPPDQDFTRYGYYMGGDPMKLPGDNDLIQTTPFGGMEDPSKKIRKPYTITKSRESWSDQEHDKFLEALQLFDRDWKKIEAFVGSKTVIQIRSHAQKYFLKVQKSGASEHLPPPRPKRKASHPYPQKAPKNVMSQATGPLQSSAVLPEPGYAVRPDALSIPGDPLSSWTYDVGPTARFSHMSKDDVGFTNNYSSSSNESTPRVWTSNERNHQVKEKQSDSKRVMPDFAQVYSFIGSVFDPNASDHLQRLREMDPINVETVLMLMKNLSVNLVSPEFEDHRRLLSSYDARIETNSTGSAIPST